jgi:hypothetical protein
VPDLDPGAGGNSNPVKVPLFPRLNRVLHRTGLKDGVTHRIPVALKSVLKRGYYRSPSSVVRKIDPADRAFLQDAFRQDVGKLADLLREDLSFWLADAR